MGMSSFCVEYDFEIERVSRWISENGFRKVLIQFPPALMRCHDFVIKELEDRLRDTEVIVSANPSYGACLVDELGARCVGADAIIHFGHLEYPGYKPSIPTLFVALEWLGVDSSWLEEALRGACNDASRCCVATTAQHLRVVKSVAKDIGAVFVGLVLGCIIPRADSCDKLIVIAGGDFHCLSASLALGPDRVVCLDPYERRIFSVENEVRKLLSIRLWKVSECIDARKWLVIDGVLGQHRKDVVERLVSLMRSKGVEANVAIAHRIDECLVRELDSCRYDCIVVAACPRLAMDDLSRYEKPVLTPGEAVMSLRNDLSRYVYPW